MRLTVIAGLLSVMLSGCGQAGKETAPVAGTPASAPAAAAAPATSPAPAATEGLASASEKSEPSTEKSEPSAVTSEPSPADERPAATPASAAEWADIQKFVQNMWSISAKHEVAHKKREVDSATSMTKMDLVGMGRAQVTYLGEIKKALTALERSKLPKVANQDADRFIAEAYLSLNKRLLLERDQTMSVIAILAEQMEKPTEQEIATMRNAINFQTMLSVRSLHRLYWTYGYQSEDIDEKSYAIKKGAKPASTVSFNRG